MRLITYLLVFLLFLWLLLDDVHKTILESFLVFCKPILLPSIVEHLGVEVVPLHASLKEADSSLVIRLLFELERSAVLHELLELGRVSRAKIFKWCFHLLLFDGVVLLVLASAWETLPWKRSFKQVKEHVADCFQVVTPGLLNSFVGGDRSVSSSSSEVLSILIGDVFTCTVLVALGETEINNVDIISGSFGSTNQEVIWLDIPVNNAFFVNLLDMTDELKCDHQNSL